MNLFLYAQNFQNTLYCSNYVAETPVGFSFSGTNSGTELLDNTIVGGGYGVLTVSNGLIGPQLHKGNKWYRETDGPPAVTAGLHARLINSAPSLS